MLLVPQIGFDAVELVDEVVENVLDLQLRIEQMLDEEILDLHGPDGDELLV